MIIWNPLESIVSERESNRSIGYNFVNCDLRALKDLKKCHICYYLDDITMDLPSNTLWYNHFFILMRFLNTIYGSIWFGDKGLWLKRSFIIDYLLSCIMYFSTYKHVVLLHTLISYTTRSNTTTDVLYTLNTLVFYSIKNYGVCEKPTFTKVFTTYYLAYQISQ